jgi:phosphomannomutase
MTQAPLMLSVSGMRGWIGQSLTPPVAARYAAAFGQWLRTQKPRRATVPHVVIGRDSRPSGPMIELAATAGLISVGCRVTSLGLATTPGVAIMTEHLRADGGMVITASHNPIQWNGIKALRHDGVAPPPDQIADVIDRFKSDRVEYAPVEALQALARDESAAQVHVARVLAKVNAPRIRRRKLKVVLDSVHGAGGPSTAMLLAKLGVEVVHLYAEPTGRFPHPPEPTRDHLTGLCAAVKKHKADIGLAQDPDADRLALVDERGRYLGEEFTLVLACLHALEQESDKGARDWGNKGGRSRKRGAAPVLVANLSTSRMIDDVAARFGAKVVRSAVGEANVAAAMRAHGALIGGEGNGGVMWPAVIHVRDSLGGIALILELLASRGQPASAIAAEIPHYAIVKDKVDLRPGLAQQIAPRLRGEFAAQKLDFQDGVRVDWPDRWVHVRPSNTEPIVRIIGEARDEAAAQRMLAEVRGVLGLG